MAERVADGNHVLLTGQRRMGKTSLARELGRRLECDGWLVFYVDLEEAVHPEDVVALLAQQLHPVQSLTSRLTKAMGRLVRNVEEISAYEFRLRIRAELDAGNWRRHGEALFEACATEPRPVLVVLDELPIFLLAMLQREGRDAVDDFLTWLRAVQQNVAGRVALELLTEAATQGVLTSPARDHLEAHLATLEDDVQGRVSGVLDVLVHDGYLVPADQGHVFQSRLLQDWWLARFGRGHKPLEQRTTAGSGEHT